MTDTPISIPYNFQTFKEIVQREIENNSLMTLRWNSLSTEGKINLATKIKTNSRSKTIKEHPKASIENIINAFNIINPILEQTRNTSYDNSRTWSFQAAYIESRKWLQILSTTLIITLKLRKTETKNYCDLFLAHGGWGAWSKIHTHINQLTEIEQNRESNPLNEITLEEVHNASPETTRINN